MDALISEIEAEAEYVGVVYPRVAEVMLKAANELRVTSQALEVIAGTPDPGMLEDRPASFYRIHAEMLKKIARIALGHPPVSPETFALVDQWLDTDEGKAFIRERDAKPAAE